MNNNDNLNRNRDYEMLNDSSFLTDKKVIIYGAGNLGKRAAAMLSSIGINGYAFCDRDTSKVGMIINGVVVYRIEDIENSSKICMIVAIADVMTARQIENSFEWLKDISICSYFALEKLWNMKCFDSGILGMRVARDWYKEQAYRLDSFLEAIDKPVLIYQNGKVGSTTVFRWLTDCGIECAHIHRNYFLNDVQRKMVCGDEYEEFSKRVSFSSIAGYLEKTLGIYKGKKIITMVRDPISVDLSSAFQWLSTGHLDRYISEQYAKGYMLSDAITHFMYMIKGRLFNWFNEELLLATGINVYDYPFDKDNGFCVISNDDTEILVMQLEKMDGLHSVIEDFLGTKLDMMHNYNIGEDKAYHHIYKSTKEKLLFKQEYIDFYYDSNEKMKHFYNENDIELFKKRWKKLNN